MKVCFILQWKLILRKPYVFQLSCRLLHVLVEYNIRRYDFKFNIAFDALDKTNLILDIVQAYYHKSLAFSVKVVIYNGYSGVVISCRVLLHDAN